MNNINSNNPNISNAAKGGLRAGNAVPDKGPKPGTNPGAVANSSDSVSISTQAKAMEQLEKAVKAGGDVDIDKVAAIRNSVEDGTYSVDPKQLAKDMIKHDSGF